MSLIFFCLVALLVVAALFPVILHRIYRAPRLVEKSTPKDHQLAYSEQFLCGNKGKKLFSWFIPAGEKSHVCMIIVHGWGANAEMMLPLAKPFHRAGMDVLIYSARNHGKSDSDSFSSLPRFAEDLETAIDWIKQKRPESKVAVLGHSIGAAAAILSASRRRDIDLLIAISSFAHPQLVMGRHLDRPWLPGFVRTLIINYIQWVIGFRFEAIAPMKRIRDVDCPVLLSHGSEDTTVPISDMYLIQANAKERSNVSNLSVDGAGHDSVDAFLSHSDQLIEFIHANCQA
jgi:alpha-beta hydrolase superfamily lysophospholipase